MRQANAVRVKVRPVAFADGESENHERRHGGELGPGGEILQQRSPAQAHDVHLSQNGDQEQSRTSARG